MCAIASYRVLPAVSSGGGEFGEALGAGVSAYRKGVTKREKKKEAEEKRSAYHKAALESGMELSGLSYDEAGKGKYSYRKKKDSKDQSEAILKDPGKTIKRAMLGLGDPEAVGSAFGIEKPKPVETLHGPIIGAADQDYGQVVQRALKERFAPNVEESVISRDFLGLPQEKAQRRTTFNEDARKAVTGEMSWDELKKIHPEKYKMIDALELEFPKAPTTPSEAPAVAPAAPDLAGPSVEDKVLVISPKGQKGYIPKSKLQKALKDGFKIAE